MTLLRQRVSFFISMALSAIILSPTISLAQADKIFRENSPAVVVVVAFDAKGNPISQGSGFIVREDGAIVTNFHVISNVADIKIKAGEKVLEVEGFLHMDEENDIVILKAEAEGLQTVKFGDIEKLNVGQRVYVISSPEGLENTISDGILSGIREINAESKVLQITAPISPGSSGGPVFNENGEVVGIATALIKEAQNVNFAMPANLIKDKISADKVIALGEIEVEDYTETAEYWFWLGVAYGELGMHREAIEAYKQAISINPDLAVAHYNLGVAYSDLGMHREAIEAYKQAISINPDLAVAHYNLGVAYSVLGNYREAIEAYKQAIRIKPDDAEAYYFIGVAYAALGMYREAIEAFKQAIRINPDYAEAHVFLGFAYSALGMHREAIEAYKQAIRIKPNDAEAHVFLGFAYSALGMRREEIEAYKQAIRINPDSAEAHYFIGGAYGGLGMYREAIEAFKQAIRINPDYAEAHHALGSYYLIVDDRASALEEYKILKNIDPHLADKLFDLIYE